MQTTTTIVNKTTTTTTTLSPNDYNNTVMQTTTTIVNKTTTTTTTLSPNDYNNTVMQTTTTIVNKMTTTTLSPRQQQQHCHADDYNNSKQDDYNNTVTKRLQQHSVLHLQETHSMCIHCLYATCSCDTERTHRQLLP